MKSTIYSAFACALIWCFVTSADAAPNAQETQVDLVYFGNTFGVSAHRSYSDIHELRIQAQGFEIRTQGPYAYACGGFTLASNGPLTVMEFEDALAYFLSPDGINAKPRTANGYLSPFETVVMPESQVVLTAPHRGLASTQWRIKTRQGQPTTRLFYDDTTPLTNLASKCAKPDAWQIRFATHAVPGSDKHKPVLFVRRPFGDGVERTKQLLAYLQQRVSDRPIVVSAGNNFEGLSFLHPSSPDLQRANTLRSLGLLKTDVLMMGQSERRFGVEVFKKTAKSEGIPAIDTLGTTLKTIGDKKLLLVNLNPGDLSVEEYTQAIAKLIKQSRTQREDVPDLVVGFGALEDAYTHALETNHLGLDLVIGQFKGRPYIEQSMQFELKLPTRQSLRLLPIGQTCWGELSLNFTSDNTLNVSQRTHPIFSSSKGASDDGVNVLSKRVNQVRQAAFKMTQIPFLNEMPSRFKSKDGWRSLSVKAYQSHTGTDMAAMETYPVRWSIQSPVLRLNAIANLPISQTATIVNINGGELKKALGKGFFVDHLVSGLDLTSKKVGGRPINDRRSYSLATTPEIADRLAKTIKVNGRSNLKRNGEPLGDQPESYIQTIILDSIPKTLKQLPPNLTPPTKVPEWFLDLSQLTLEGGRLHRIGVPEEYSDVSEPRLTTKDHQQLAIKGHLEVGYDSDGLSTVNYLDWAFAQSYLQDSPAQETDDRLNVGNELVFNQFRMRGNHAAPFFRTAYLTEFTAADVEGPNRRKQRLESVLGSLWRWDKKNQARLGLSVAADLATESSVPQYGMYGQFDLQKKMLGFESFAKGELRYLPPMLQQLDSRQLQLYGDAEVGFLLPVWHRLSIRTYVGGFYYQSDARFDRTPGINLRGGVALNLDHFMPL
jgi:hypothetical protein